MPIKDKFTVICDARFGHSKGINTLVMLDKKKTTQAYWWTGDNTEDIIQYRRKEAAENVASKLKNNARVVTVNEALSILTEQQKNIESSNKKD